MALSLEELFDRALDLEGPERSAFLDRECGGDSGLRTRVEALLLADAGADDFLRPPEAAAQPDSLLGRQLGAYVVDRRIGAGGMSHVYLAHRADGSYEKQVALKLLRAGFSSDPFLRRFRIERQVLAKLQHPHIAQLIDGGVVDGDRPYLVMEYVDGDSIDAYAAEHRLDLEARLKLFLVVCDAVQFAHRNLVVHRDLKPSNIMVDKTGSVRLLDFGIAKVLEAEDQAELTLTRDRMLTPRYASPEQIGGKDVTTASDSYSLGVLLFELLTGRSPYALDTTSPTEIEQAVITEPPMRPSRAVTERSPDHFGKSEQLSRRLRGDLDNILLKALRKEPARRYASVDRFADDISRHLQGLPVSARPDTFRYRMGKFVSRNRAVVGLSAALLVMVAGAAIVSTVLFWQAREARDVARSALAEAEAERVASEEVSGFLESMFATIDPAVRQSKDPITVEELLADAGDRIGDELGGRPKVAASLYTVIGASKRQLTQYDEAIDDLTKALSLLEGSPPGKEKVRVLTELGRTYSLAGDLDKAAATLERSVDECGRMEPQDSQLTATALRTLGDAYAQRGDHDLALDALAQAVALRRTGQANQEGLAKDLTNLGLLHMRRGENAQAEPALTEARDLLLSVKGPDHSMVAEARSNLAYLLMDEARYSEATAELELAVTRLSEVYPDDHPKLLQARGNLARCYQERGNYDRAEAISQEVIDSFVAVHGESHQNVGHAKHNMGFFVLERGDAARAAGYFEEATLIYRESLGENHPYTAVAMFNHARALRAARRYTEAETVCLQSLAIRRSVLRENHPDIARSSILMGDMLFARKAYSDAEPYLREGVQNRRVSRGPRHPDTAWGEMLLGACLFRMGQSQEALPLLERSAAVIDSAEGPDSDRTRRALDYLAEARGQVP